MPTDILQDPTTGDIDLSSGDVRFGESTRQHQRDILAAHKGDFKTAPGVGVGLETFLRDENTADLAREIRTQMAKDGMTVNGLSFSENKLTLDANY